VENKKARLQITAGKIHSLEGDVKGFLAFAEDKVEFWGRRRGNK
jgi:hypothetical protein